MSTPKEKKQIKRLISQRKFTESLDFLEKQGITGYLAILFIRGVQSFNDGGAT